MPTFGFSFAKKEVNKREKVNNSGKYEIIERKVTGVVFINLDASYYIKCGDKDYDITPESYTCKGKTTVYRRGYDDKVNLRYIRTLDSCVELNPLHWIPFSVGCVTIGNIVVNNITKRKYFDIKSVDVDYTNNISIEAHSFYREHYKEINDNLKNKWLDESR